MMKRTLAVLCAMLMLVSAAVSCGKTEPAETTAAITAAVETETTTAATAASETEPPKAFDSVPAQQFVLHGRSTNFSGNQGGANWVFDNEKSPENQLDIYEKTISDVCFENGRLVPLTQATAEEISGWVYESPYEAYSFKGTSDDWLLDTSTWGTEQFCLMDGETILGQVACQLDGADLWVGWSMAPHLCGKGNGDRFVQQCVQELLRFTGHTGQLLLRVTAWNRRAIRAYEKAGFQYVETIQDEIAYSNHMENFWVMSYKHPI